MADKTYKCGNCEWSGTEPVPLNETNTATQILERFDIGGHFTDSECPDCGSLAYPVKTANNNCLDGLQCPKCKALEPFQIRTSSWTVWTDDGTQESTEFEYDSESYITCIPCGHGGQVQEFEDHDLEVEDDDEGED